MSDGTCIISLPFNLKQLHVLIYYLLTAKLYTVKFSMQYILHN